MGNSVERMIEERPAKFGLIGFLLGGVRLVAIVIQLSAFSEPQEQTSGVVIREIAAEIKQSAARVLAGETDQARSAPALGYSRCITILALGIAGFVVVLGAIGLYRNEPYRLPYLAIGMGSSAVVIQYVFWLAVLICGVVLLISILDNLDCICG